MSSNLHSRSNASNHADRNSSTKPYQTRKATSNSPGQLSVLALSMAAVLSVLAAPRAWALDTPASQSSYSWDSTNDVDVSISNGVTIGGSSASTGLSTGSNNTGLGTLTNQGMISGTISGLQFGSGGSATLIDNGTLGTIVGGVNLYSTLTGFNNSGIISAPNTSGIVISAVNVDTITNSGAINGFNGIYNYGTIGTLDNSEQMGGTVSGIYNYTGAVINTITNGGTLSGGSDGITNRGSIGTLTNSGMLSGGRNGFDNYGGTISALSNTGTIAGTGTITSYGIANDNSGVINAIDNIGTLATISGQVAISNNSGATINTLTNSGTIIGNATGVANAGSIGTLSNSGAISGNVAGLANGGTITRINNTGTINVLNNTQLLGGVSSGGTVVSNSSGIIGAFNNSGSITGADAGISNGGSIGTLSNTGLITGSISGVINGSTGSITTLNNNNGGTINGVGTSGTNVAIANSGVIGSLLNNGVIHGSDYGISITGTIGSIGTLNNNSGTISGGATGIYNNGVIGTLFNSATIMGGVNGVSNDGHITLLQNIGLIDGSTNGLNNTGTIDALVNAIGGTISDSFQAGLANFGIMGTLTNNGVISGANGLANAAGSITSIINGGTIVGANYALYNGGTIGSIQNAGGATISGASGIFNYGTIGPIDNGGTIIGSGGTGYAIYNDAGASIGVITNSGLIGGLIQNDASTGLTIVGGSGSTFGTLTGSSGGIGSADIGVIASTGANLNFASGNLLLNDNINVGSNTVNNTGATLQVNNHINITGNYHQSAAATLQIGVSDTAVSNGVVADTGYGRLVVSGTAVIDSGSSVKLKATNSYGFAAGQRYVVVQAATSGTNYNASSLVYSATGYSDAITGSVVIDGSNSNLLLTFGSSAPNVSATTTNAVSAISGLFKYSGVNTSLLNVFNAAAAIGSTTEANRAGAQLSPTASASAAAQASTAPTQSVLNVAGAHVDGLRIAKANGSSGIATGESGNDIALWGQAFGGNATQDQRDNISGYKASYNGLLIGGDKLVNDAWRLGGLVSYADTSVSNRDDNSGSWTRLKSYGLIGYAGYTADSWYLDLSGGVVRHNYDATRLINFTGFSGTANGSYSGTQSVLSAQGGYPIRLDATTVVTPVAGLHYSKLDQDGYTESGGNGAALTVAGNKNTSLKSDLGAKLERSISTSYGTLVPSAQLIWRHEYRDTRLRSVASYAADTSGATSFVSYGAKPVSNTGIMALSLTLLQSNRLTMTARYTLEAASGYQAQTADVRLRYQF